MSLKIPEASVTPQTVYTGAQFIISVLVYDDAFEFSATLVEDQYQGFADTAGTIGGKLQ